MRFRLGMVTGFASGYYLGARAGRQRYDQINRSLSKLRGSDTFETAAERAKAVVEEGVEKAKSLVDTSAGNGTDFYSGSSTPTESGLIVPGSTEPPA